MRWIRSSRRHRRQVSIRAKSGKYIPYWSQLTSLPLIVFSRAIKLATTCIEAVIARSQVASMPDIHVETDSQWTLTLQPPASIRVRSQQSIVELRASAKPFWRTMGFEPLAGGKDVTAFAMFEEGGSELSATVAKWLRDVTDTYQVGFHGFSSCRNVAEHLLPGNTELPSGQPRAGICRSQRKLFGCCRRTRCTPCRCALDAKSKGRVKRAW